jgi:hypothetical protein
MPTVKGTLLIKLKIIVMRELKKNIFFVFVEHSVYPPSHLRVMSSRHTADCIILMDKAEVKSHSSGRATAITGR